MSEIKKIGSHYSMENPASVYDEEAMTALELAGRTTAKVNETVDVVNAFTQGMTQRQDTFEERTTQRQDTFEKGVNARVDNVELKVEKFDDKLTEFENETIPETVENVTREMVENGALDHVVQESIDVLGTELDALVNTATNASQASAEIAGARVGNGRVTYPTLGDAIREQTTNIKPIRLNPTGAEWKGDEPVAVSDVMLDQYGTASGFTNTTIPSYEYDEYAYELVPGKEYLFTCGVRLDWNKINNGWIRFLDVDGNMIIGATNLTNFITEVDTVNYVYRIKVPLGTYYVNVNRPKESTPEMWEISTTQALDWLRLKKENFTAECVNPGALSRDASPVYKPVNYERHLHQYASSDGQNINYHSATGMCRCTIDPVQPGQVFRIPIGKDVSTSMGNYFVFADENDQPAVQDIVSQVYLANANTYEYEVTIPEGCAVFHTACDSVYQMQITEKFDGVNLPWLRVTRDNLKGIDFGATGGARVPHESVHKKINWTGKKVLCIGDSITAGIYSDANGTSETASGSPIQRFCDEVGATLVNVSVSGSTMESWAKGTANGSTIDTILSTHSPDVIFIALGVNDYFSDNAELTNKFYLHTYGVLGYISAYMRENTNAYAVVISPIPFEGDNMENAHGRTIEFFREHLFYYSLVCGDMDINNFIVIDGGTLPIKMPVLDTVNGSDFLPDGLHPNSMGQILYARWLLEKLT